MIRGEKQEKFAQKYVDSDRRGILLLSLRFGKTRVGLLIIKKLGTPKTLVVYPENKIRDSWTDEIEKGEWGELNIIFTSTRSLHKYENEQFDLVIVDECHQLSENNLQSLQKLLQTCKWSLGLTGTLDEDSRIALRIALKWTIVASYSTEEAIEDGIIADYRINIVTVPLDNQRLIQYKKKKKTEKAQFNAYSYIINKLKEEGKDTGFLALSRMRIIQNSISKMEMTRKLLKKFKDERVLVFCGLKKIAEQLGIPVHHSDSEDDNITPFMNGEGNHLAVIKIGVAGLTYVPLNRVIINYFDSSSENLQQKIGRAMNLEFEGQTCDIWIVSSNEEVELNWLRKALKPFDATKINYIKNI